MQVYIRCHLRLMINIDICNEVSDHHITRFFFLGTKEGQSPILVFISINGLIVFLIGILSYCQINILF